MSLEAFHANLRANLQQMVADRRLAEDQPYPSEELVFAEWAMDHLEAAGICEDPVVCHWVGKIGNKNLRGSGYSLSADGTGLDLFVTHFCNTDVITKVSDSDAGTIGGQGVALLIAATNGTLNNRVAHTHPISELIDVIVDRWPTLDRIRVFVLTDGRTVAKQYKVKEVLGKLVSVEAMDIERLFRHLEGRPRDEIEVDLVGMLGRSLPCVHVPDAEADYECVLVALPGVVLRDLYLRFSTRLLEANVRTFLGKKKEANKGIAQTLRTEPEHFLAFNNGLVLVCDDVGFERSQDGICLTRLGGIQIVNGGQTTSSIYFTTREDRNIDLSHVMVPVKIIKLKQLDDGARDALISKVSRYANSQTAVKMSDLSSNRPFHVQLEKLSETIWCPNGSTRWFYERAGGAYNVMLLREGATPAKLRRLQEMIPSKYKLTKNDIAKHHEAWRGLPHQVGLAGEKNFKAFMEALDENPGIVPTPLTNEWYRSMIAKVIIFKAIEWLIGPTPSKVGFVATKADKSISGDVKMLKDSFRQAKVNIATYVVALVANRLGDRVDLQMIWQNQSISTEFAAYLLNLAKLVNQKFEEIAPGQQFSEVAKKESTWTKVRDGNYTAPAGPIPELIQGSRGRR
jgi:hypothetical protein